MTVKDLISILHDDVCIRNRNYTKLIFYGGVKNVPDTFLDCKVVGLSVFDCWTICIYIDV